MVDLKKIDLTGNKIKKVNTEGQQRVTDMTGAVK